MTESAPRWASGRCAGIRCSSCAPRPVSGAVSRRRDRRGDRPGLRPPEVAPRRPRLGRARPERGARSPWSAGDPGLRPFARSGPGGAAGGSPRRARWPSESTSPAGRRRPDQPDHRGEGANRSRERLSRPRPEVRRRDGSGTRGAPGRSPPTPGHRSCPGRPVGGSGRGRRARGPRRGRWPRRAPGARRARWAPGGTVATAGTRGHGGHGGPRTPPAPDPPGARRAARPGWEGVGWSTARSDVSCPRTGNECQNETLPAWAC